MRGRCSCWRSGAPGDSLHFGDSAPCNTANQCPSPSLYLLAEKTLTDHILCQLSCKNDREGKRLVAVEALTLSASLA